MKRIMIIGTILASMILVLPAMLVIFSTENDHSHASSANAYDEVEPAVKTVESSQPSINIAVYRTKQEAIEELPLEEYVIGVVASEMPAQFEMEALKAQALTARTYIIKQMLSTTDIHLPEGAMVTDTVMHQVFQNDIELREKWGSDFEWRLARVKEAVLATEGKILTYQGEPIEASFFSTSNGYTENSEEYWQNEIPYLRSVESPWDKESPRYIQQTRIPVAMFQQKLGVSLASNQSVGEIIERTTSNRVAKVSVNGKVLTGRDVREKLELDSTDFTWRRDGNEIVIETKGWGHGVGMSQYGAEGMAKEGSTYEKIVQHFYQGIDISTIEPYIGKLMVRSE